MGRALTSLGISVQLSQLEDSKLDRLSAHTPFLTHPIGITYLPKPAALILRVGHTNRSSAHTGQAHHSEALSPVICTSRSASFRLSDPELFPSPFLKYCAAPLTHSSRWICPLPILG